MLRALLLIRLNLSENMVKQEKCAAPLHYIAICLINIKEANINL